MEMSKSTILPKSLVIFLCLPIQSTTANIHFSVQLKREALHPLVFFWSKTLKRKPSFVVSMLMSLLWALWLWLGRPMWKWMQRRWTGQCELLRITQRIPEGAAQSAKIESSLKRSKTHSLKQLLAEDNVNVDAAVANILRIKSVSPEVHPQFAPTLRICLSQITGYRKLCQEAEACRKVAYSSENTQHEATLMQLWTLLKPEVPLNSRINKQWTEIGFQGDDPMTDFRGMGMLGLLNLMYFVQHHKEVARQMVSKSNHPQYGYSFAIVGINITGLAFQLLNQGHLKTHFYNAVQGMPKLEHFHQLYCYLLYEFDKFWFEEKPRDIMEFNRVKNKFQKKIISMLKDKNTVLKCTFNKEYSNHMASVPI